MSEASTMPLDELNMGLATLKKNLLTLSSMLAKTVPTLKGIDATLFQKYNSDGNVLADSLKGVQKLLKTTLSHVQSDLARSASISVKVQNEVDVSRTKLSRALGLYDDYLRELKSAIATANPSVVNIVKLGAKAAQETVVQAASKAAQIAEQTGGSALNLSAVIPYLPYIAVGFGVLYLLAWLPRPRST